MNKHLEFAGAPRRIVVDVVARGAKPPAVLHAAGRPAPQPPLKPKGSINARQ